MRKLFIPIIILALIPISCNYRGAAQIFPSATPAKTATPILPPTSIPSPTLPPTPTPIPAARIDTAEKDLYLGDFEQARREFQDAKANSSDPEIQAAATYGMGRALYLAHNFSTATDMLKSAISSYPQSPVIANAYYYLAQSYMAQNLYDQAAQAYTKYLEARPNGVLDYYIQELRGDAYMAAGNPGAATAAYEAAIKAPQDGTTIWTSLKLGKAYAAKGDFSSAIKIYLDVYSNSQNDYARAQANLLMGQAYLTLGEPEQAQARFQDSVANFPKAYDTYSGLVQLVTEGVQVNELSRGMVDYYAGQYSLAIDALTRYIDNTTDLDATAYYYRALSHLAKNEPGLALIDWDFIIQNFPTDSLWPTAWDEKAYVQWAYLDQYDEAANTLLEYVKQAPESSQAADMLFQAARIMERNNKLTDAAATWEKLMDQYPSAETSYRGLFLAGVTYYRAGDYAKALTVFQRAMVLGTTPDEEAAAYLWVGKCQQAKGDASAARLAWEQAAQRDPTDYYSVRANELLQGQAPFSVTRPVDLGYDLSKERAQAEEWLRATFGVDAGTDLNGLGDLSADARVQRGAAFWDLGLYSDARDEFEAVRVSVASDPVKTYRMMNYLLDLGVYRSAILASRQVLDLAHLDDAGTLKAPIYFNHIRFGIYFKDEVLQASQKENFNPLLLLSLLRQESLFEGFAQSGAGALGLMQIMPATGQEIASGMNWPQDYNTDDLNRPFISITLGVHYLARQRDYFNDNTFAALAAYNGGPGNTTYWKDLSGEDPDLFLEVIRADETRKYITQIYEFFNIYRLIYERGL